MYLRNNDFYKFNTRKDFLDFVFDTRSLFSCNEEWEEFFGMAIPVDNEGEYTEDLYAYASHTPEFDEEPTLYPAIAYCVIGTNRTRFGINKIRVFDWITDDSFEEEEVSDKTNKNAQWSNSVFGTEVGEDFKKAVYDYATKCVKQRKCYPEIYTVLHKSVDILLYEFEVEKIL